jgi:hypothetical protein
MQIKISKEKINNPDVFLRRCGYGRHSDRRANQISYTRRIMGSLYPRLHIYIKDTEDSYIFSLHLDQRQTRYQGHTAHAGEYDGELVEKEVERIKKELS